MGRLRLVAALFALLLAAACIVAAAGTRDHGARAAVRVAEP